jgi:radical SAM superfamily enzyme YgiQ (UPF0313 family)
MRVLILNPPGEFIRDVLYGCGHERKFIKYLWPPISLAYIASVLRNLHEIKILDFQAMGYSLEKAIDEIKNINPDFLIMNTNTLTFKSDLAFLSTIKHELSVKTIIYGSHATACPEESLKNKEIDFVIRGDPELAILDLIELTAKKYKINKISGVCNKKHISQPTTIDNLDKLPFPSRDLLLNNKYFNPFVKKFPYTTMLATRGCTYKCTFCTSPIFCGRIFRKRSIENIVRELDLLSKQNFKEIFFRDENITTDKEYASELFSNMS